MIQDPEARGGALAEFFLEVEPRLFADLAESVTMARGSTAPLDRLEWACFALYACVRGLVAAGGFNRETAAAIEALHERVLAAWESNANLSAAAGAPGGLAARGVRPADVRARVAERYAEYGAIGQAGGASGAATVTARLGVAAARHVAGEHAATEFAELIGYLHESLVEGSAESVRRADYSR